MWFNDALNYNTVEKNSHSFVKRKTMENIEYYLKCNRDWIEWYLNVKFAN